MLTTQNTVPIRRSKDVIDVRGLLLLFVVLKLHRQSCLSFQLEKIQSKPKTGWKAALGSGEHDYSGSVIKLAVPKSKFAHQNDAYPARLESDSSESESESESESGPPKNKKFKLILLVSTQTKNVICIVVLVGVPTQTLNVNFF